MFDIKIGNREGNLVQGHVMDVSLAPLEAALKRYDQQLYLHWNPKKLRGRGVWELRRKPEFKTIRESRVVESPKGNVFIKGDIFDFGDHTIVYPKYHENHFENHVKDFYRLDYRILDWVKSKDLWDYGFRGKNTMKEAEYREAKYEEKIDEDADAERQYMIKQHRTQFNDFREYILAGGDPARLMDYWNKV